MSNQSLPGRCAREARTPRKYASRPCPSLHQPSPPVCLRARQKGQQDPGSPGAQSRPSRGRREVWIGSASPENGGEPGKRPRARAAPAGSKGAGLTQAWNRGSAGQRCGPRPGRLPARARWAADFPGGGCSCCHLPAAELRPPRKLMAT